MPSGALQIWARVVRGLEWVAAAEAELLSEVSCVKTGHRDVLFRCDRIATAHQLRCIDDAFAVWDVVEGLDHTRASLEHLVKCFRHLPSTPLEIPPATRNLRVTVSFLGRRNYSRYEVEEVAGQALAARLGLRYLDSRLEDPATAVWCRIHLFQSYGRIGLRTTDRPLHRRHWRTEGMAGALHPPVAAAMAKLADLHPGQIVVDPFVGTATLLIEAGLQCADLTLVGCDIAEAAVARGLEHGQHAGAGISLDLSVADASVASLPEANRVLSNPPWGVAVQAGGQLATRSLAATLLRSLKPSGRSVLLADQRLELPELLQQSGYSPLLVQPLRISGRLTHLVVVGPSPCFPTTKLGQALLRAWKTHSEAR